MSELVFDDFFAQYSNENSYEKRQQELFSRLIAYATKTGSLPYRWYDEVIPSNPSMTPEDVWKHAWDTTTNCDIMIQVLILCGVPLDTGYVMASIQPMSRTYRESADGIRLDYPDPPSYELFLRCAEETWTPSE